MDKHLLRMVGVDKTFGAGASSYAALRGINLTIDAGEFVAVTGPSGAGKSSLLAVACGLERPTRGDVFVDGTALHELSLNDTARLRRRSIGFVGQNANLVPSLTALENVAMPREFDGATSGTAHHQAQDALRMVGILDLADRFLHELTIGQQQRVAVARAVVGERRLILADDPADSLDSSTGDEVLNDLRGLADAGTSILLATEQTRHTAWADRVIFINGGRIIRGSNTGNSPGHPLMSAGLPSEAPLRSP